MSDQVDTVASTAILLGLASNEGEFVQKPTEMPAERAIAFGPFRVYPERKLLLEGERAVAVGSRAFDILVALLERPGTLLRKEDLMARVWPDTFVEEANLRVHVAALRKALGDGQGGNRYLATDPGRGYSFVAPVSLSLAPEGMPSAVAAETLRYGLPGLLSRMVGRVEVVTALAAQLPDRRLVTVTGPGGIGKTTVAISVAHQLAKDCRDGAYFVDLAPLSNPALVPSMVASAFGLPTRSDNPIPMLIATLRQKQLLLVIDSCEHVLDVIAGLVEDVLKAAPEVSVLVTSREPLRAEGEHVFRLSPLGIPPEATGLTAAEALSFPAVQLFVERATASDHGFALTDGNARIVADICCRLDGIALAIELAAGRVNAFGLKDMDSQLNDRFRLLTSGRRAALPRHRTLRAALDWSYEMLPEAEQAALGCLAIFAGSFDLEAAIAVAGPAEAGPVNIVDGIANLVAKSLVSADTSGGAVRYRLLDTTRAYALEKLRESGALDLIARRHAEYYRQVFERAESDWRALPVWLHDYARHLDNLRAALDWAASPAGDPALGVALTVAAVPLWTHLSLIEECRERVERALSTPGLAPDPRRDMKLNAAFGAALEYTRGPGPEMGAAWTLAFDIAAQIDEIDYQLRSLWGLWVNDVTMGRFNPALALARKFHALAEMRSGPADRLIGDRMLGFSLYLLGDQAGARLHTERMLAGYVPAARRSDIIRFQFDQRVLARATLAEVLWLQGFPDRALQAASASIEEALAVGHESSLSYALAQAACSTALRAGDVKAAERYVSMLLQQPLQDMSGPWNSWGRCFSGLLRIIGGNSGEGIEILRSALDALPVNAFHMRHSAFLGEMAGALCRSGDIAGALAGIDEALERAERNDELWCFAELQRLKGEIVLQTGRPAAAAEAEQSFHQSLDLSRRQGALSWELRTATSLAGLQRRQGRVAEARELLAPVYDRFDEGFGTRDLQAAKRLLDELSGT